MSSYVPTQWPIPGVAPTALGNFLITHYHGSAALGAGLRRGLTSGRAYGARSIEGVSILLIRFP